ncbi:LOW QUALITY PROTEIN: hypothetical protein M8C21_005623, partial [Ambrosia artemisiifolia]
MVCLSSNPHRKNATMGYEDEPIEPKLDSTTTKINKKMKKPKKKIMTRYEMVTIFCMNATVMVELDGVTDPLKINAIALSASGKGSSKNIMQADHADFRKIVMGISLSLIAGGFRYIGKGGDGVGITKERINMPVIMTKCYFSKKCQTKIED